MLEDSRAAVTRKTRKRLSYRERVTTLTVPQKPRTTTIVDMAELDSTISPGGKYKQFQSPTLSIVDIKELEGELNACDSPSEQLKHAEARRLTSWPLEQNSSSKDASNTAPGPSSLPRTLVSIETTI